MFSSKQFKILEKITKLIIKVDRIDILDAVVTVINQRKQRIREEIKENL